MVAGGNNMPEADIEISEALVRRLLVFAVADQGLLPGLASLELRLSTNGWENAPKNSCGPIQWPWPRPAPPVPPIDCGSAGLRR